MPGISRPDTIGDARSTASADDCRKSCRFARLVRQPRPCAPMPSGDLRGHAACSSDAKDWRKAMALETLRQVAMRSMPFDISEDDRDYNATLLLRAAGLIAGLLVSELAGEARSSGSPVLRVLAVTAKGRKALECGREDPETPDVGSRASGLRL
jgi:hypothetical protein